MAGLERVDEQDADLFGSGPPGEGSRRFGYTDLIQSLDANLLDAEQLEAGLELLQDCLKRQRQLFGSTDERTLATFARVLDAFSDLEAMRSPSPCRNPGSRSCKPNGPRTIPKYWPSTGQPLRPGQLPQKPES